MNVLIGSASCSLSKQEASSPILKMRSYMWGLLCSTLYILSAGAARGSSSRGLDDSRWAYDGC